MILAKTVEKGGPEWDERLPYVLFAYRASQQASLGESPIFLVYGRDPLTYPTGNPLAKEVADHNRSEGVWSRSPSENGGGLGSDSAVYWSGPEEEKESLRSEH